MVLYDHRSIQVLNPRVLIPAMEKVIKPRPYQIYRQKTGSRFWSLNYTRSKIPFFYSCNKLQIFKFHHWANALHWHNQNKFCLSKIEWQDNIAYLWKKFCLSKMELQGNIAYIWKKKVIMILEQLQIFVRKTTS